MMLTNDAAIARRSIRRISGLQGGPLIACHRRQAVALGEALQADFKRYARRSRQCCSAGATLVRRYDLVTGAATTT